MPYRYLFSRLASFGSATLELEAGVFFVEHCEEAVSNGTLRAAVAVAQSIAPAAGSNGPGETRCLVPRSLVHVVHLPVRGLLEAAAVLGPPSCVFVLTVCAPLALLLFAGGSSFSTPSCDKRALRRFCVPAPFIPRGSKGDRVRTIDMSSQ